MLSRALLVALSLVMAPSVCGAEPFRTTTKGYASFDECTNAMWGILQLLSGDKALLKWNQAATQLATLELVDEAGKRTLIRANCEELPNSGTSRDRFRGFIEFP